MHKVEFSYLLASQRGREALIRNPLMDLLHAVHDQGSISAAARALNLSYRHVWGELKRWEQVLAQPLIVWDKGQSARLNEFGNKLLWAERQAQARLAPQIEALRGELERAFAVAFDPSAHVLTLYASHDDALLALREHAAAARPGDAQRLHLDIRFTGSVDAISALNEGRCTLAGFHTLPQPAPGTRSQRVYKPLLKPGLHKVIGFVQRRQGLMVARGNPLRLRELGDLVARKARCVNRALGTGTRVLFDELLDQAGLLPRQIDGYEHTEPSHAAVAQCVAAGQADAGFGIEHTAYLYGLDFVPLSREHYHLVCLKSTLEEPAVQALCSVLRSSLWQQQLMTLPGYAALASGQVQSLRQLLPWWNLRPKPEKNPA